METEENKWIQNSIGGVNMSDKSEYELKMLNFMKRITLALEQLARKGEKSVDVEKIKAAQAKNRLEAAELAETISTDSKPWPKESSSTTATTVVETKNYIDVRECIDYSEKSYKLIGYDSKYAFIAKQFVVRVESIEGGGTRVIVNPISVWALDDLGWK